MEFREAQLGIRSSEIITKLVNKSQFLTHLVLPKNKIGDEGCLKLEQYISNHRSMIHLDLRSNEIGNNGLMHIFAAVGKS